MDSSACTDGATAPQPEGGLATTPIARHHIIWSLVFLANSPRLVADGYRFVRIDVPDATATDARGINARGNIVGSLRAGRYTRIDVPGSLSTKALAINDAGVIVGNFTDGNGVTHGFKATPRD